MIDFRGVTKTYGKKAALSDVSFSLREPKIYGLIGRNGAGKTTLMKLLAGKIAASEGEISVSGARVSALNMPENVRYIEAAKPQFNMRLSALFRFASFADPEFDSRFALRMAETLRLDLDKKYNALSFGMKTMVTTILSLSSRADVILLDEPVLGFDAVSRREFYSLLMESYAEHPRILIVSTHLIDEIADIAEHILMLREGRLVLHEDIHAISEKAYKITGLKESVALAAKGLNMLKMEEIGKYAAAYIYDERIATSQMLEITGMTAQELFVMMAEGDENA